MEPSVLTFGRLRAVQSTTTVCQVWHPGVLHRRLKDLAVVQALDGPEVAA